MADALLIEVAAGGAPSELDLGGFTQEEPGRPRDDWQVPWMEQWLDESGYVAPNRPLITPAGPIELPQPAPLPARLAGVQYEPVD